MEAAKVLYEAGTQFPGWGNLTDATRDAYVRMALALLRWEHVREPSDHMIIAGANALQAGCIAEGAIGTYRAMSAARIKEVEK